MTIKKILREKISDTVYGYRKLIKSRVLAEKNCRILMYHSIEDINPGQDTMNLAVSPEIFYMHMKYLKDNGFYVMDLSELANRIKNGSGIPEKSIAITFDDGFKSILTHAFPVLQEFGFKATLFVNVYFIERKLPDGLYWRDWQTLDWGQVKDLHKWGLSIGSHAFTHRKLTTVDDMDLPKEIVQSKELIEKHIAREVSTFCYPHGAFNSTVREVVAANGYHSSCSSIEGVNNTDSDIFALRRTEILPLDDTAQKFEKKILGSSDWLRFVRNND